MTDPQMIEMLALIEERLEALTKRQAPDYRGPYSELSQSVENIATSMNYLATELTPLKKISTYSISAAVVRDVENQINELDKSLSNSHARTGQLISKLNEFSAIPLRAAAVLLATGSFVSILTLGALIAAYYLSNWDDQKCAQLDGTIFDAQEGPVCGFYLETQND